MLRFLPMALFGLFTGVIAQRVNRHTVLRYTTGLIVLVALAIYWLAAAGVLEVWHLGVASFISGLVWATDFSARRTLMGELAGPARISRAMSLDILGGSATRILGPIFGGVLYQQIDMSGALLLGCFLYFAGFVLAWLTPRKIEEKAQEKRSVVEDIRAGLGVLKQHEFLPGFLVVTITFNLWVFPFTSMVPVIGKDILALSDALTGFLSSAEGVGALIGAIGLSVFAKSEHSRYFYVLSVVAFCVFAILFSFSTVLWLSFVLLLIVGFVSAAFGAMQTALVLMNAPAGYERQMMGILTVCIGTAPIGFLHIGLLADLFGPTSACLISATEGIVAMALTLWRWPNLLTPQVIQTESN